MIKQINILFFLIIFSATIWCSDNNGMRREYFRLNNRTGYVLDVQFNSINNRPCYVILGSEGGPFFKSLPVYNIFNKEINVYSYKNYRKKTIHLYFIVRPIN